MKVGKLKLKVKTYFVASKNYQHISTVALVHHYLTSSSKLIGDKECIALAFS